MIKFEDYEVPRYIECDSFSDGLSRVKRKIKGEILFGFINTEGKEVIPCKYDYASSFTNGFSVVESNSKFNFINTQGKKLLNFLCKNANDFSEGLAAVQGSSDLWGFVDTTGRKVIQCKFKEVSSFQEGHCIALTIENNLVILKKNGDIIELPSTYRQASDFEAGLSIVEDYFGYYGIINTEGKTIVPCFYDYIGPFEGGLAEVRKNSKTGVIDKTGRFVIITEYDENDLINLGNGNIVLGKKGKLRKKVYGIVNAQGETVIPFEYDEISVENTLTVLKKRNKTLYLTSTGKLISAEEAATIYDVLSDDLVVTHQRIYGLKNKKTGYFISEKYIHYLPIMDGMIAVCNEDLEWGFVDINGREVIPCKYDYAWPFSNGLAFVRDFKGNEYFIDKTGQKVIDLMDYNSFVELNSKAIVVSASSPLTRVKKKKAMLKALSQAVLDDVNNLGWELESEQNRLKLTLEGGKKND